MREITVWTLAVDGDPPDEAAVLDMLDDSERERLQRLRIRSLRRTFLLTHGARRMILASHLGADPAALTFTTGVWGKPELSGTPLFHSLSHSGRLALVAVSQDAPVGVDIERICPDLAAARLAATFFRPEESERVAAAEPADQPARYIRFWTRKEAAGKATGAALDRTLTLPVSGPTPVALELEYPDGRRTPGVINDLDAPAGHLAAVALLGSAPFLVKARRWPPEEPQTPALVGALGSGRR